VATVGVRELKNRLTLYLRRARQGEEVVVTERGKPIALIRPIHSDGPEVSRETRLARMAARGLVTLPTRRPLGRVRPVKVTGEPVSRTILQDRR